MKITRGKKIILVVSIVLIIAFRLIANHTTLLVNTNTEVPNGYLPINDYVMIDKSSGKKAGSIKCINYAYQSDDYEYSNNLETSLGIDVNSSWDEFVDAYGDYIAESISSYFPYTTKDNEIYDDDDEYYLSWITVKEFDEKYIQTGKVSLEKSNIYIYFTAITKLNKVYYTASEQLDVYQPSFFFNYQIFEFQLSFKYLCPNDEFNDNDYGVFDYIISDRWDY